MPNNIRKTISPAVQHGFVRSDKGYQLVWVLWQNKTPGIHGLDYAASYEAHKPENS
jgi:hypothetical protein